ncbi:MAG TPA: ribonuclease HII [Candidatus Dormibacteraeota bacterium]
MAPSIPTLRMERSLWQSGSRRVVGVDECGMGSLCSAVVAAACLLPPNCRRIAGVRDSKTLSARQRERLAAEIRRRTVVAVGAASVAEIDRLNIYHASHLAMRRALRRIGEYDHVLVDGRRIAGFEDVGPHTAVIDGDALCYAIACASVVAKVTRDRLLARLALRHPGYGWERNAGYSTREHLQALRTLGVTPHHRRSFAPARSGGAEQVELDLDGVAVAPFVELAARS